MAERSRGVYRKMADTSSGVHRRRWQIQAVAYKDKMLDRGSGVHRRIWKTQAVA